MCKESIFSRLIKKGFLSLETLLTNTTLISKNLLTRTEILKIMSALLYDEFISESDLDVFNTNTWITSEEKAVIISEKAPC